MGVFARLLRRSSGKSTQDGPDATPAEETGTAADPAANPAAAARADAGRDEGTQEAGPDAGVRAADGDTSRENRENTPGDGDADAASAGTGPREAGHAGGESGEVPPAASVESGEAAEAAVGIPKQQSADKAADSETGDNARK
ncbi:hypothetical protein FM076_25235 [Streptomyces albus subsp. chlorinus]|uniref:hypothetical protein n=1 Tax=Streptomyces albus TaxID=1888 RepID=UPI00156F7BA9|nr:hypothetical protein [Streptomyces albus]NSC24271.1 hypothetical protein [Streptomyces albus subsp. chlorinus]